MLPVTITEPEIYEALHTTLQGFDWSERVRGHHFLALVQEEERKATPTNKDKSQFCVYTFDSAPEKFEDDRIQRLFYNTVCKTAKNLGWSKQRNTDEHVKFGPQHQQVLVVRQAQGGWQCGLHVVLNAWILALGFLPHKVSVTEREGFYEELWILIRAAVAGLLDWKTLVAWLFCHKLVATRSLDLVPGNRRFEATQYQDAILSESGDFENEIGLVDRVQATSSQGQVIFAGSSEDELPYDYSNNVNFADTDGGITVAGSSVSANSEKKKKAEVIVMGKALLLKRRA